MKLEQCLDLTKELIRFPSVTGEEHEVTSFFAEFLKQQGWQVTLQDVENGRQNIYATRSAQPKILFTTHVDVVPALKEQFQPIQKDDRLYGRGACDAKGVAASMVSAAARLPEAQDLALLFVVGEEASGLGAQKASEYLRGSSIEYIVNGEPTECKLMQSHRGGLGFEVNIRGIPCHSGYPELGKDANKELVKIAQRLYETEFGTSELLGTATLNIGEIEGGTAGGVISPEAKLRGFIRTTLLPQEETKQILREVLEGYQWEITYDMQPVNLITLPGFETDRAKYATDIPNLIGISDKCLLYGPGSIHQAHTVDEYIEIAQVEQAIDGYIRIYQKLQELMDS